MTQWGRKPWGTFLWNERDSFFRSQPGITEIFAVVFYIDQCALNYGVSPCTASTPTEGNFCWYSFSTCQDPDNFSRTIRPIKFYTFDAEIAALRSNGHFHPYLLDRIDTGIKIDPKRALSHTQRVRFRMRDNEAPPIFNPDKPDPSLDNPGDLLRRNTSRAGSFWRNFVARHPNFKGRAVDIFRGWNHPDFLETDFIRVFRGKLDGITFNANGTVTVEASTPFDLMKQKIPRATPDETTLLGVGVRDENDLYTLLFQNLSTDLYSQTVVGAIETDQDRLIFSNVPVFFEIYDPNDLANFEIVEAQVFDLGAEGKALQYSRVVRAVSGQWFDGAILQDIGQSTAERPINIREVAIFGTQGEFPRSQSYDEGGDSPMFTCHRIIGEAFLRSGRIIDNLMDGDTFTVVARDQAKNEDDLFFGGTLTAGISFPLESRWTLFRIVREPIQAGKLLQEVLDLTMSFAFINEAGIPEYRHFAPKFGNRIYDDAHHILHGTMKISDRSTFDDLRVTRITIGYDLTPGEDDDKLQNYRGIVVRIAAGESGIVREDAREWGEVKNRTILSQWVFRVSQESIPGGTKIPPYEVTEAARRWTNRFSKNLFVIEFRVPLRLPESSVGETIIVKSSMIPSVIGQEDAKAWFFLIGKQRTKDYIQYTGLSIFPVVDTNPDEPTETGFQGVVAPNTVPEYTLASVSQRKKYAFAGTNVGNRVGDDVPGYVVMP